MKSRMTEAEFMAPFREVAQKTGKTVLQVLEEVQHACATRHPDVVRANPRAAANLAALIERERAKEAGAPATTMVVDGPKDKLPAFGAALKRIVQ